LIADDSKFIRLILRGLIRSTDVGKHADIIEAHDGTDAVRKYFQYNPHLVFLDINMPNMSGLEVLHKIKSKDPNAKIIVISALGHEELVRKALEKGVLGYITKPFHPNLLKEILRNVLGGDKHAEEASSSTCR